MNWWLPPRSHHKEILDAQAIPQQDLEENLQDLRRLNVWLGSRWVIRTTLRRLWQAAGTPSQWRILDIGTGAGDIPAALTRWRPPIDMGLTTVAIDARWQVIRYARQATELPMAMLQADGLCLPFRAGSFDVAVCSTMLHHLAWHEGVALLREMAAVARHGVIVNDLVRGWGHYYGAKLLLPLLSRNRLTLHDGPLSVLRAYNVPEVRGMAQEAGLTGASVRHVLMYRLLLVYRPPGTKAVQHDT